MENKIKPRGNCGFTLIELLVVITLTGTGTPGQPYVLLTASNLTPTVAWKPIATNTADSGGVLNFSDPQATNYSQRFYHVSTP